jgi:hypothetical protein
MNEYEGMTPIQNQDGGYMGTPIAVNTPIGDFGGGRSEYSMVGTPHYDANMSPGYINSIASPHHGARSPSYMSPGYGRSGQSPIYGATGQSPIYSKATPGSMMSPAHNVQSMSSPLHSPAQTMQSPAYAMASVPYKSPSYPPGSNSYSGGVTSQSPAYQSSSN